MDLKAIIIKQLEEENGRPIPAAILANKVLEKYDDVTKQQIYLVVNELVESNVARKTISKGNLVLSNQPRTYNESQPKTGIISLTRNGHGYIKLIDEEEDKWFVFFENTNDAFDKDVVEFAENTHAVSNDGTSTRKPDAKVLRIVTRSKDYTPEKHSDELAKFKQNREKSALNLKATKVGE